MRVFVAEDDAVSRKLLVALLQAWGHEVVVACDGEEAWSLLKAERKPVFAILDWMMPGLDGAEICSRVRAVPELRASYLILLTAKTGAWSAVEGLDAGADDFLAKPFDRLELQARIRSGSRVLQLQAELAERVLELETALGAVRRLQGLLPICCVCKRIRDGQEYWQQVEVYLSQHSEARFSHGLCPDCLDRELQAAGSECACSDLAGPGGVPPSGSR